MIDDAILGFVYFDTNVVLKHLLPGEEGTDVVEFIINNKGAYNYLVYTSQIAIYEIDRILKRKVNRLFGHKDYISRELYDQALHRLRKTLYQTIKVIDERSLTRSRTYCYRDLMVKVGWGNNKSWDARHWAVILNFIVDPKNGGGADRSIIINADKPFNTVLRNEGFTIVDPASISIEKLRDILQRDVWLGADLCCE